MFFGKVFFGGWEVKCLGYLYSFFTFALFFPFSLSFALKEPTPLIYIPKVTSFRAFASSPTLL